MRAARASDAERDQAIGRLRDRFAEGRLSQETFLYRMDAALKAKDRAELAGLFVDLPEPEAGSPSGVRRVTDLLAALRAAVRAGSGTRRRHRVLDLPALCLPRDNDRRFTIGRALSCDLTLADLSVSRWHARLHHEDDGWQLSDLGSTNGTRLNGWRVTTAVPVRLGDLVSFGGLTFVITDRPAVPGRDVGTAPVGEPAGTGEPVGTG
jgi:hypothetical protein